MLELPVVQGSASFTMTVELEGSLYRLTYSWMGRTASWYLDVATLAEDPILSGVRLVLNWPLWGRLRDDRLPPGHLFALSMADDSEPGQDDLGSRVRLVYYTAAEVEALASEPDAAAPMIVEVA